MAIKEKINSKIDTSEIEVEIESLSKKLRQLKMAKDRLGKSMDSLDFSDELYEEKYEDMQVRLNDIYVEINDVKNEKLYLEEKIENIRQDKISEEKVYQFLLLFDIIYEQFTDSEKKEFLSSFIERIEINPDYKENGQILKSIKFKIPVYYDEDIGEVIEISFPKSKTTVETVALLRRKSTEHHMKLFPAPFEMIKSGNKTIELRLFDEKRQQIKAGDTIVFTNTETGEALKRSVIKLHRFDSFEELYKALPLLQCGYTKEDIDKASPADMLQYYSAEQQQNHGVVGIELFRAE